MRIDKLAMTSREALQTAMSTAADAQAGAVEPIHLLSALLGSRARRRSPRGAGSRPRSTRAAFSQVRIDRMICRKSTLRSRG